MSRGSTPAVPAASSWWSRRCPPTRSTARPAEPAARIDAPRGFVLRGRVVDETGVGLEGVRLEASRETGGAIATVFSGADGTFAVAVPGGRYGLRAIAPGFRRRSQRQPERPAGRGHGHRRRGPARDHHRGPRLQRPHGRLDRPRIHPARRPSGPCSASPTASAPPPPRCGRGTAAPSRSTGTSTSSAARRRTRPQSPPSPARPPPPTSPTSVPSTTIGGFDIWTDAVPARPLHAGRQRHGTRLALRAVSG